MSRDHEIAEREMLLKPRRRRLRRLLGGTLVLLVILGVATIVAVPIIGARLAPGLIHDAAAAAIRGPVEASDVRISWLGSQRAHIHVLDPDDTGSAVIEASVSLDRSLLGLLRNRKDIAISVESARVNVIREADGATSLQRALEPVGPSSGDPMTLPSIAIDVQSFDMRFEDRTSQQALEASGSASLALTAGKGRVEAHIEAREPGRAGALGVLTVNGEADGLTDGAGELTVGAANGEVHIVSSLSPAALRRINPALEDVGELDVTLLLADGYASLRDPLTLALASRALVEQAVTRAADSGYDVTIGSDPTLAVEILTARIPIDGADWQTAEVDGAVAVGAAAMSVVRGDDVLQVRSEPGRIALSADATAATLAAKGSLRMQFDDNPPTPLTLTCSFSQSVEPPLQIKAAIESVPTAAARMVNASAAGVASDVFGDALRLSVMVGMENSPYGVVAESESATVSLGIEPVDAGGVRIPYLSGRLSAAPLHLVPELGAIRVVDASGIQITGADILVAPDDQPRPWGSVDIRGGIGLTSAAVELEDGESGERHRLTNVKVQAARTVDRSGDAIVVTAAADGAFGVDGSMVLTNWYAGDDIDPDTAVLEGSVKVTDLPVSLAGSFREIVAPVTGDRIDLHINADPEQEALATLVASGASGFTAESSVDIIGSTITTGVSTVDCRLPPAAMDAALARFAPDMQPRPRLAGPAACSVTIQPMRLDIDASLKPKPKSFRNVYARVVLHDDVVVHDLPVGEGSDLPRSVGLRPGALTLSVGPNDRRGNEVGFEGNVFDPATGRELMYADVLSGLYPQLKRGEFQVSDADLDALGHWLGKDDLLQLTLGSTMRATAVVGQDSRADWFDVTAGAESELFQGSGVISVHPDRITTPGFGWTWRMTPEWFQKFAARPGSELSVGDTARVVGRVVELALPRDGERFAGDRFRIKGSLEFPALDLVHRGTAYPIERLNVEAATLNETGAYGFRLWIDEPLPGPPATDEPELLATAPELTAQGSLRRLHDSSGSLTLDHVEMQVQAEGRVETALVDALVHAEGMLIESLGPQTAVRVVTDEKNVMTATLSTERAALDVVGRISAGAFVIDRPSKATVSTITPELSRRLLQSFLPLLQRFEKTADNRPVLLSTNDLVVPLNGDLRQLQGNVTLDAGTMQFIAADWLGPLLDLTKGRRQGALGGRVDPVSISFSRGVATINAPRIGLGEVNVSLNGGIDLTTRQADLVLLTPIESLDDELKDAVGNLAPGRSFVNVPIRVRGDIRQPSTELALDLLIQNSVGNVLDGLLRNGLNDLFGNDDEDKKKGKNKKKD